MNAAEEKETRPSESRRVGNVRYAMAGGFYVGQPVKLSERGGELHPRLRERGIVGTVVDIDDNGVQVRYRTRPAFTTTVRRSTSQWWDYDVWELLNKVDLTDDSANPEADKPTDQTSEKP